MSIVDTEALDGAVLDVNLGGERVDPVADALAVRKIPFVFVTGYGKSAISERFPAATVIGKPFDDKIFLQILGRVLTEGHQRVARRG
jgi:hypothetical protein